MTQELKLSERYNLFPIKDEEAWKFYVQLEANFWTPFEADYVRDKKDYEALKIKDEKILKEKKESILIKSLFWEEQISYF